MFLGIMVYIRHQSEQVLFSIYDNPIERFLK
jgi:hypothetical protein